MLALNYLFKIGDRLRHYSKYSLRAKVLETKSSSRDIQRLKEMMVFTPIIMTQLK